MGYKIFGVFRNSTGDAVASPPVNIYLAGTLTAAAVYSDVNLTTPLVQPITGDANGNWEAFVSPGYYRATGPGGYDEDNILAGGDAPFHNIQDYGAVSGNSTDATAAIQRALDAAHADGRPVYVPGGTYKVIGSGTEIFKITEPIQILGCGKGSSLVMDATVPATRSLFLYEPATTSDTRFFRVADLNLQASGGSGKYGILIRPAVASTIASRFTLERLWIQNLGSFGVYLDSSVAGASGIFTSTIRDCQFNGNGVGGDQVLDSILIDNCVCAGTGYAADIVFGSGPGKFTMRGCNVSASSGVRFRGSMAGLLFEGNYLESQSTYDGANGALLDLDGDTGTFNKPVVRDCIFTALTGTGAPNGLRLNKVNRPTVSGTFFNLVDAGSTGIVVESNATRVRIDEDNQFQGSGTPVEDGSSNNLSHRMGGVLNVGWTTAATSGTTEETMFTAVVDAGLFDQDGRALRLVYAGSVAANANSKTVNVKLNGTLLDGWSTTSNAKDFTGEVLLVKDGSSTQKATHRRWIDGSTVRTVIATGTETDTSDITITVTMRSPTSSGDITFEMAYAEMIN